MNGLAGQPHAMNHNLLQRLVRVKRGEVAALFAAFTMFFALLCAYYIVRPVRDQWV